MWEIVTGKWTENSTNVGSYCFLFPRLSVPGEPRRVKLEASNSTAVLVEWRSPSTRERNGIIRGYQIHYVKVNERDEPIGLSDMYDVRGTDKTSVVIGGLQPDTWYQFQVAAYTRKGDGERSRPKTVKTKGAGKYCEYVDVRLDKVTSESGAQWKICPVRN